MILLNNKIAYTCDIDALNNKVDSLEKISHGNNESIATIMNEYPTVDEVNNVLKEYALKKDISKFREKNDLKYKESIEVPFENVQDSSGMWEVKIKMNRGTRLVGTITDESGVVKNFDFMFDYDADVLENTDIDTNTEIDGITYPVNYYQTESGEWRFNIESDTGFLDTKLILAGKILKLDEIALKSDITSLFDDLYWRIFYSGFHKSYYEDIPELCSYSYNTSSKKLIVVVEYASLYTEMLFIFYDSNDKRENVCYCNLYRQSYNTPTCNFLGCIRKQNIHKFAFQYVEYRIAFHKKLHH